MHPLLQRIRPILMPRKSRRERFGRLALRGLNSLRSYLGLDYQAWIKQNEPDNGALQAQKTSALSFACLPLISIVMPVLSQDTKYLGESIRSLLAQTYPSWELCLVIRPNAPELHQALAAFATQDERIRLKTLDANPDDSGIANLAIQTARGDFIGFLDSSDCLAPFALYAVVETINQFPETDLLYTDDDFLSANGRRRYNPGFKPAFSIDYLRATNYIQRFLLIRTTLGAQLGWLRQDFANAQEYDLILRAVELARQVTHVPQVLYHRRALPTTTSPQTTESGLRAISEHLSRCGLPARVQPGQAPGLFRITYEVTDPPLVSIIIPNHEHAGELRQCVDSILTQSTCQHFEILIVENNSRLPETLFLYQELTRRDSRVRVLEYHYQPFNYSEINNYAVSMARGSVLLFLNNDTQVASTDWLERLLEYALRPDVGVVGARLTFPNWLIQHAGVIMGLGAGAGHHFVGFPQQHAGYRNNLLVPQNLSAVTAACLMMRRAVFDEIGGFERDYPLAFGDIDLCLKVRQKDYLVVCTPYAHLIHYESMTRGFDDTREKEARFTSETRLLTEKWAEFLADGDPFYNPNLTLSQGDFSVRAGLCQHEPRSARGLGIPPR